VRRRLGALALAVVSLGLGGCGYSLRGTLPSHIRTIGVPMFVNLTRQPGVESTITTAIVHALATDGRLKVVRPADADAVL
jgi:outer membrane lipopolysaccharide assembly protein LptE/RlpB